jgi:hypothetical protein
MWDIKTVRNLQNPMQKAQSLLRAKKLWLLVAIYGTIVCDGPLLCRSVTWTLLRRSPVVLDLIGTGLSAFPRVSQAFTYDRAREGPSCENVSRLDSSKVPHAPQTRAQKALLALGTCVSFVGLCLSTSVTDIF